MATKKLGKVSAKNGDTLALVLGLDENNFNKGSEVIKKIMVNEKFTKEKKVEELYNLVKKDELTLRLIVSQYFAFWDYTTELREEVERLKTTVNLEKFYKKKSLFQKIMDKVK